MPDKNMRLVWEETSQGDLYVFLIRQINKPGTGWRTQLDVQVISAHPVYWNQRFTPSPFPNRFPDQHADESAREEARKIGEAAGGVIMGEGITQKILKALDELKETRPKSIGPGPSGRLVCHQTPPAPAEEGHPRNPKL
jgi:hypothetical protein